MSQLDVLIVDDVMKIIKTMTLFMVSRGHRFSTAASYRRMDEVALARFDIAFIDLRLCSGSEK